MKSKRMVAVVLVLAFAALLAGCSQTAEEPAEVQPPFFDEALGVTVYPVGNTAAIGDWEIYLRKAFSKGDIEGSQYYYVPEDGNAFVVASMDVTNKGGEPDELVDLFRTDGIYCVLVSADGTQDYAPGQLQGYDYDLVGTEIAPGETVEKYILTFEVPNDVLEQVEVWNLIFYTGSMIPEEGAEDEVLVFQI